MQMIDVMKRLAEIDAKHTNIETMSMTNEQSLATVSNIAGETITESITECGPMGMMGDRPSTPASFSINASAESGAEVSSMLRDIMNLAGVKPVSELPAFAGSHQEIELEPAHQAEFEPQQSAGDEMGDLIGMVDRMNGAAGEEGDDLGVAQGDVDGDGDHDMADHGVEKTDSPVAKMADEVRDMAGELADEGQGIAAGFDTATTTPDEKIKPHAYGNDQVTPKPKEPAKVNGGGNPYTESVDQVSANLLKAYEAFKNGQ
jgi:hypothetical protein